MIKTTMFAAALLGAGLCCGSASAQTVAAQDGAAERLARLEAGTVALANRLGADVADLQVAQLSPNLAADFEIRLQRLERTLSELTGRVEESTYQVNQLKDRVERMNGDIDFRLQQVEKGSGGAAASGAAATARTDPAPSSNGQLGTVRPGQQSAAASQTPAASNDPQRQYEQAFELLQKPDYDGAEKAFLAFLAKNKGHALAGNAQYWLGETYYVRNKFPEAAKAFAEGFQTYPKNNKAPDNLLKLGMSLAQLNQKNDACTALKQLNVRFPEASASIKRRGETERRRLNCPA